jgi:hypothetical protein
VEARAGQGADLPEAGNNDDAAVSGRPASDPQVPNTTQHRSSAADAFERIAEILMTTPQIDDEIVADVVGFSPTVIARVRRRIEKRRSLITDID